MKKIFLILILVLIPKFLLLSQNLVYNPSFEEQYTCPDYQGQIAHAIGWKNCGNTPDLLSACSITPGFSVPWNQYGFQYAASGNSYAGTFQYWHGANNLREYIGTKLITPLQKNTKYFVSMKVSPIVFDSSMIHMGSVFINNLGFLFTNHLPDSMPNTSMNRYDVKCDSIIKDTMNWTVIKGSFIADSNYTSLIIGSLLDDAHTLIDSSMKNHFQQYTAYYFIDNVCVTSDSVYNENYITGFNDIVQASNKLIIFPNPANTYITIKNSSSNEIDNIEIISVYGGLIKRVIYVNNTLDVSFLPNGLYFIKLNLKNNQTKIKSLLKIN